MPDPLLQPIYPPSAVFAQLHLPATLSSGLLVTWGLYIVFAFWAVYTVVAIYHWFKYSHASWVAFPAIAAHLFISFALMSYTLSGHAFFLSQYLP